MEYPMAAHSFTTPCGNTARMHYRQNTNDWNTIQSAMVEDEYGFGRQTEPFEGCAVDVGAHIGAVAIGLALDNPKLEVVCVEPVPENISLLQQNVLENRLASRVIVVQAAIGAPGQNWAKIRYRFKGTEIAAHHTFIGNCALAEAHAPEFVELDVPSVPLTALEDEWGPIRLLKIDCEGGEWKALTDPTVKEIDAIVGEWHNAPIVDGRRPTRDDLTALLPFHSVSFTGPVEGPGGFSAFLK